MSTSSGTLKSVSRLTLELLVATALLAIPAASRAQQWDMHATQQQGQQENHGRRPQMQHPHNGLSEQQYYMALPHAGNYDQRYRMTFPQNRARSGDQQTSRQWEFDHRRSDSHGRDDYYRDLHHPDHQLHPGKSVDNLPRGYHTIHSRDRDYYLHGGYFYQRAERGFTVVRPPFGAVFPSLPADDIPVSIGDSRYFFCDGAYFQSTPSGYAVVKPPHPATAATMDAVANVAELIVRQGPGTNYGVVDSVNDGTELPVYGHSNGWYYVQTHDGTFGWVRSGSTVPLRIPQG